MTETTGAGLLLIIFGLLSLLMNWLFVGILVRGYSARNPGRDTSRYERRQRIGFKAFAAVFFVAGLAMLIYGLMGGDLTK